MSAGTGESSEPDLAGLRSEDPRQAMQQGRLARPAQAVSPLVRHGISSCSGAEVSWLLTQFQAMFASHKKVHLVGLTFRIPRPHIARVSLPHRGNSFTQAANCQGTIR